MQQLTGLVKDEEVTSYQNMNTCVTTVTTCFLVFSLLEVISYYLYLFKVWQAFYFTNNILVRI